MVGRVFIMDPPHLQPDCISAQERRHILTQVDPTIKLIPLGDVIPEIRDRPPTAAPRQTISANKVQERS